MGNNQSGSLSLLRFRFSLLIAIAILLAPAASAGNTYYIDSTGGNDSNDGLSEGSAWKTLDKANGIALLPGDAILLKRGGTFGNQQLIINGSGSASAPITIGAYGSGAKPVINPSEIVENWTQHEGSIYYADIGAGRSVSQVFVAGLGRQSPAHYPNSGYFFPTQASSSQNSAFIDAGLSRTEAELVGATIHTRDEPWVLHNATVASYDASSHTVSFSPAAMYPVDTGDGYFFTGKLWMLDQPSEWHYDSASGRLYLWASDGSSPAAKEVRASVKGHAVYAANSGYIQVRDLGLEMPAGDGLRFANVTDFLVDGVDITYAGDAGVQVFGNKSFEPESVLSNLVIKYSGKDGILSRGYDRLVIRDSHIEGSGTADPPMDVFPDLPNGGYCGIRLTGKANNTRIENNAVLDSGYDGISILGTNHVVRGNLVDGACSVLSDCAGIRVHWYPSFNNTVESNIIMNIAPDIYEHSPWQAGIYFDLGGSPLAGEQNNVIRNNIIVNASSYGIFVHNYAGNSFIGNTVYGAPNPLGFFETAPSSAASEAVENNEVLNNTFLCSYNLAGSANPWENSHSVFMASYASVGDFADFGGNRYYSYPASSFLGVLDNWHNSGEATANVSYSEWLGSGQDAGSLSINSHYSTASTQSTPGDILFLVNTGRAGSKPFNLDRMYCDLDNSDVSGTVVLPPWSSRALFACYCNSDGACNNKESHASCPSDCTTVSVNDAIILSLNGAEGSFTAVYGTFLTVNASSASGTHALYKDGAAVSNPYTAVLAAGYYSFTANSSGNANYNAAAKTYFANITRAPSVSSISAANWSILVGQSAAINCSIDNRQSTLSLYRNGTPINSSAGNFSTFVSSLAAGAYNFTCLSPASENYSASNLASGILAVTALPAQNVTLPPIVPPNNTVQPNTTAPPNNTAPPNTTAPPLPPTNITVQPNATANGTLPAPEPQAPPASSAPMLALGIFGLAAMGCITIVALAAIVGVVFFIKARTAKKKRL